MSGVHMEAVSQDRFICRATHGPSGTVVQTEAPKDNGGTGGSFSPTDLLGCALLTCMLTTLQLVASREGIAWGEASGSVEKRMSPPPRRIAELVIHIRMPRALDPSLRAKMEQVARTCPVALSLHPDVRAEPTFSYES